MAKQALSAQLHLLRALNRWPKDTLRPTVQFQDALRKQFEAKASSLPEDEKLKQANALYSLLDNRYRKRYPITGTLLEPKSKPTYFKDLIKELDEAPHRSWLDRALLRVKGIVRIQ